MIMLCRIWALKATHSYFLTPIYSCLFLLCVVLTYVLILFHEVDSAYSMTVYSSLFLLCVALTYVLILFHEVDSVYSMTIYVQVHAEYSE